jgi:hypothetical protein
MRSAIYACLLCASVGMSSKYVLAEDAVTPIPSARDFSGVWTTYRDPDQSSAGPFMFQLPELPLTEEGTRRRDEYRKLSLADRSPMGGDNPGAHCVPYGMPSMMEQAGGYPIEFIQRPEQLTIIFEVESETRRVYLSGPGAELARESRLAVRQGYSIGHWEGDTLIVQTTELTDGIDQMMHPHSDQASIVERFKLVPDSKVGKILEYEMTMTDPVYYTDQVTVKRQWMPLKDGVMMPYNCSEEPWLRLLEARRKQLEAGEPITAKMSDVIDVYD